MAITACAAAANLDSMLVETGYLHAPLAPATERSLEAEALAKEVVAVRSLHSSNQPGDWHHTGEGSIVWDDSTPVLTVPVNTDGRRAKGSPDDPDYALYGHAVATLALPQLSLDEYNRFEIDIEPRCPGNRAVTLNLSFSNATGSRAQGYNEPTGAHLIILDNNRVNRCFLEIGDFRRDAIETISLSFSINGRDMTTSDTAAFRVLSVEAQRVPATEKVSGWQPADGHIIHSMSGYAADGAKSAIVSLSTLPEGTPFTVVDTATGHKAFKGKVGAQTTSIGRFGVIDFTKLRKAGDYRIEAAGIASAPFHIGGEELWDGSCWKVLNFIFCQRCGYPVPGVHSLCHDDLMSEHNGLKRAYNGGWHDAGDLSQQTLQTADVAHALLELSCAKKKSNPLLAARLREEALWGIEFVLRNRFGDGFHASSVGLLIWQDGIHGSHDDISTVRVQDVAYDNFLYAAYEAYASKALDNDPMLASYLATVAEEDYAFACRRFEADGFGGWINPYEHTYCTGESQHMATASWAASMLYDLTGREAYAADAARYADYVLASRCDEAPGDCGIKGFFYRNPSKKTPVHYIHQSREQLFMEALIALCRTQPEHPSKAAWHQAVEDYAGYLKALMAYTAPYGMLPAGIFSDAEPDDTEAFYALHLFPPSNAPEQFKSQASKGVQVAPGYFVKRFPVWFNIFNGNLAVHTSMGKSAALCARYLHDAELLDIAREQLYWTAGKNPFAQSLIYGEGHRYPELNNFSSGRITGAMPVGIRSLADTDEPYWPQINNACYKEVWLTSAGKWLSLVAETELYNTLS